jgi:hypothetical protein
MATEHVELRDYALQNGWEIWWEHHFPNGSNLGLRYPGTPERMSLTFHGEYQLSEPRSWHHAPELNGTVDHCGYWWGPIVADKDDDAFLMCAEDSTQARKLIRERQSCCEDTQ